MPARAVHRPAAARRAGRHGDGYLLGGRLTDAAHAAQIEIMRVAAAGAGWDPDALEYTRWGSIDMTVTDVEASAGNGATRLVVGPTSPDLREQISAERRRRRPPGYQ
jgi:alkanesulfonate monooxygenase SsuD/methylene tetrahydromethanopterin reductase-like flavin-dependent oxidoreductase (luciferase family)